jgi:hypothetical protein
LTLGLHNKTNGFYPVEDNPGGTPSNASCQERVILGGARLPTPTPAPTPAKGATAADEPHYEKEDQRPDSGVDDRRDNAGAKVDAKLGHQPLANEGSYDPDDEVTDHSKPGASDDLSRQPPRNEADQQYDK